MIADCRLRRARGQRGKRATELGIRISEFGIKRLWFSKGFFNSEFRIPHSGFEKPSCHLAVFPSYNQQSTIDNPNGG
jgi:hypothetical protein